MPVAAYPLVVTSPTRLAVTVCSDLGTGIGPPLVRIFRGRYPTDSLPLYSSRNASSRNASLVAASAPALSRCATAFFDAPAPGNFYALVSASAMSLRSEGAFEISAACEPLAPETSCATQVKYRGAVPLVYFTLLLCFAILSTSPNFCSSTPPPLS